MAMAARPPSPLVQDAYGPIPQQPNSNAANFNNNGATHPDVVALSRGYGSRSNSRPNSFVASSAASNVAHGALLDPPSIAGAAGSRYSLPPYPQHHHNPRFHEDFDAASQRGSVVLEGPSAVQAAAAAATPGVQRSVSQMSQSRSATPTRTSTLKKRASLTKRGSMRRSGSKKSMRAGSVRSLDRERYGADGVDDINSAFAVPIPTDGNPTESLANRFQSWRKILKDLIIFFKEIQKSYEMRSKLFLSASNVINNSTMPPSFLKSGGIADATEILRDFHRQGYLEANKAAEVESEVVNQLMSLRNDLHKKIKEIKGLASDFKNTVEKEVDSTRKSVRNLHDALDVIDSDPAAASGRGDPFIVRLNVDRQIEKQIEEENYLHRAYLNLENSGRELESIVVSEIQKAYNAYASVLKREADEAYDTVEKLRAGPIGMPQDHEWNSFISSTDDMVDPRVPLRNVENITYPGRDHPAAAEVRSGMLERKSKYLKSYTPGWYVLSPTHLHEFKSADLVASQTPMMSLYLPEQKLGQHSEPGSSSYKFMLKGRQTGTMHRGHSWVFRAETHETMISWFEDIGSLISKTGEARNAFVRRHVRSVSGNSITISGSSDVMEDEEDEADRTPYSSEAALMNVERPASQPRQPGGRFPSDVHIDRHLQVPLSPSSGESSGDRDLLAVVGSSGPDRSTSPLDGYDNRLSVVSDRDGDAGSTARSSIIQGGNDNSSLGAGRIERHDSYYGEWIGPAASAARQQQQAQYNAYNPASAQNEQGMLQPDNERRLLSSSDPNLLASTGSTHSQDPSGFRRRRESASTAPTTTNVTNVTDHTNNTLPTSIDEPSIIGAGDLAGPHRRQPADETLKEDPTSTSIKMDGVSVTDFPTRGLSSGRSTSNQIDPSAVGEELKPTTTAATGTTGTTGRTKGSVSALELKIPGHYPPHVTA